nr:hypothetical protein [Tanacetum cinerariifolium]
MSPRRVKKKFVKRLVEKHMAKTIEEYEKTRANLDNVESFGGNTRNAGGTMNVQSCLHKSFMNGKPHSFNGTDGVVGLRCWIEKAEHVFEICKKLAEQLQAQEREQLSIEERSKLLAELIESRRKYFTAKRAKEIRNKPPTKAQPKSLMCTYMKNMKGYKQKDFKGKIFDAIKKMFDKVYKRVNTFMAMDSEVMEGSKKTQAEVIKGSSKREGDKIEQESAKRQRLEKEDDTTELKRCLEIVPKDDDDITIEATPLSSKSPTIVDYKI